jgi:hypothetical protein
MEGMRQVSSQQQPFTGELQRTASDMQVDVPAAHQPAGSQMADGQQLHARQLQPEQQQQQQQQQQHQQQQQQQQPDLAAALPRDLLEVQPADDQWQQECADSMLHWAVEIAEDEADGCAACGLTEQRKEQLLTAYGKEFEDSLQQRECPSDSAVRAWLRLQLGVAECSYDEVDDLQPTDAGQDAGQQGSHGVEQQQQQQQQQQQPKQRGKQRQGRGKQPQPVLPSRRSTRATAGCVSAAYAAVYGVTMGCSRGTARDSSRDQGQGGPGRNAPQGEVQPLSTPPADPPPLRRTGRKVGAA